MEQLREEHREKNQTGGTEDESGAFDIGGSAAGIQAERNECYS
jgi:hypothetical protein